MTDLPDKPTYRVSEVAFYFGVTGRTVYVWIENGKLEIELTPMGQYRITENPSTNAVLRKKRRKMTNKL